MVQFRIAIVSNSLSFAWDLCTVMADRRWIRCCGVALFLFFGLSLPGCGGGSNQTVDATEDDITAYENSLAEGGGEGDGEVAP